jgi:hypothetical protein
MAEALMYMAETPPFTLTVVYELEANRFRVTVQHEDGRARERFLQAGWEPRFGIDVADQDEINKAAEEMCVEMETK